MASVRAAPSRNLPLLDRTAKPPSWLQLRRLMLQVGIPFIGFGFLDNAIMITAGDTIDATFGATLGLSALAAAGLLAEKTTYTAGAKS